MPNREHTPVDDVESARRETHIDRPAPEAEFEQLPTGDDTVLLPGQFRDPPLLRTPSLRT